MAYECILLKPALEFIDTQVSSSERKQIFGIIENICADSQAFYADGEKKFYFPALPVILMIWIETDWWVIYHKASETVLHVVHIGKNSEQPHIRHT
jgi:hypothetical protein